MIQTTLIDPKASVPDMVGRLYGDMGLTYKFITDNSFIDDIDTDLSAFVGYYVTWDDSLTNTAPPRLTLVPAANPNIITYQSQPGQSIYDICLQTYNTLDRLYKLIADNNIGGTNGTWPPGALFTFEKTLMNGTAIYNDNMGKGTIYATLADGGNYLLTEGGAIIETEGGEGILL